MRIRPTDQELVELQTSKAMSPRERFQWLVGAWEFAQRCAGGTRNPTKAT